MKRLRSLALLLTLCSPASAGIILAGDEAQPCDPQTQTCCEPDKEPCPRPDGSTETAAAPDPATEAALAVLRALLVIL